MTHNVAVVHTLRSGWAFICSTHGTACAGYATRRAADEAAALFCGADGAS